MKDLVKNKILGVGVTNATEDEILEYIITSLEKKQEKYYIVTPNPEILVYATKHQDFKNILNNAKIALNDGVGVSLAGKVLGKPFKSRVTGVDLMEKLCSRLNEKAVTVGFLGGRDGVAEKTAECLKQKYPKFKVVFAASEWSIHLGWWRGNNLDSSEVKSANNHNIDILFVAFGHPKQEMWMAENINKLPVRIMMGVGGSFDYISGRVPRAPLFIRKIGFEWLFRLTREPWRIKRQLSLVEFVWKVVFRHAV